MEPTLILEILDSRTAARAIRGEGDWVEISRGPLTRIQPAFERATGMVYGHLTGLLQEPWTIEAITPDWQNTGRREYQRRWRIRLA